jgi:LysR family transcriptional regulator of gallate degradation
MATPSDSIDSVPALRHLRCFLLAAELGSIVRAAEEVGMSQPAASNAIARLEHAFGGALLVRRAGGSAPSAAGALLEVRARRFFALLDEAVSQLCDPGRSSKVSMSIRRVHIRALIAVAETGSFSQAARRLGISGPALHRAARDLEGLLRCPLFQTQPQGIGVNTAGGSFARQLRLAASEIVQAHDEIGGQGKSASGRIAIGVLPLLPKRWIARVIAAAKRSEPDMRVELREGEHAALVRDLRWGALDLIVGALPPHPPEANILQQPLFADPYVLVVRRGHRLAKIRKLTPAMLATQDWIVPSPNLPRRGALERFFATLPGRPRIWLDTASPGTMIAAVAETDCVTLISRTQFLTDGAANLAILPLKMPDSGRTVGITRRRDWLATPAQRSFLEALSNTPPTANGDGSAERHRSERQRQT